MPTSKEEITRFHSMGNTIADLEEQLENVQKSIDKLALSLPSNNQQFDNESIVKTKNQSKRKKSIPLASSNGSNRQNFIRSPCSPLPARQELEANVENGAPKNDGTVDRERLWWSLRKRLLQRVKKVEMSHQIRELLTIDVQV